LVRLGANSYFGEIALLTQEPRTATVTICSATAKVLKMTKAKFDDVMASCNATLFNSGKELGKAVVEKVPLFHSLTANKKRLIVESMRPMNFKSNTYICRQGSKGNTFYIITEGSCKVTINAGQGAETDIAKLGPGDFFGTLQYRYRYSVKLV
jgi:CRP-like cAMP-binding protein